MKKLIFAVFILGSAVLAQSRTDNFTSADWTEFRVYKSTDGGVSVNGCGVATTPSGYREVSCWDPVDVQGAARRAALLNFGDSTVPQVQKKMRAIADAGAPL